MSDPATPRMRWWGWGTDGHDPAVPDGLDALLRAELGVDGRATRRRPAAAVPSGTDAW